jgi:hypothetical protein
MSHIKLISLVLDENIEIPNVVTLENECKTFAQKLIDRGLITSAHKDLTSSDVAAGNYVEDIAEVIRNAIINWDTVVNDRGGR